MVNRLLRLLRHRWMDSAERSITLAARERLTQAVANSELRHLGEIRVCIEAGLPNHLLLQADPLPSLIRQRAVAQFAELGVWDTEHNNGVLIYLLLAERAIELVADRAIYRAVPPAQWQAMVQRLGAALREGRLEEGVLQAIQEVGAELLTYFPASDGTQNPNELPNQPLLR